MTYVDAAVTPLRKTGQIKMYGPAAFAGMRKAGRLAAECLDMLAAEVTPGVHDRPHRPAGLRVRDGSRRDPRDFDVSGLSQIDLHVGQSRGLPRHPDDKPLREGDIVNIDVTLILDGWHGNSSRMYAVGEIPRRAERLIEVTYEAMMRGIAVIKPGATTGDIGARDPDLR